MRMTVADMMTRKVVSVTAATPFKEFREQYTGRVNGVVGVIDELTWNTDDSTREAR
ncbi:hypothetical protein [Nonomuraea fuscirosea]|uniref:hypothetical protein n=1 Tax=Nonomuraea fuscirosea TaxID=1291556 RepID=UPI00341F5D10